MYSKRIKIFIIICLLMLLVCILRLAQMQLFTHSSVQEEIEKLKNIEAKSQLLLTNRGKILDRNGRVLAIDRPTFWLNIDYKLSQYWDPNYQECRYIMASRESEPQKAKEQTSLEIQNKVEEIKMIMEMCEHFGFEIPEIQAEIEQINKKIWDLRYYLAWKNKTLTQSFEEAVPDPNERLLLAYNFRIPDMKQSYSLFELKTDTDVFTAQFEFMDIEGIKVISKGKRFYPYNSTAAQTIGWVGGIPKGTTLFEEDPLKCYMIDEVCGRDGIEYVCEPILRGRRGEENSDIDRELISRTDPLDGGDVILTIDIELQKRIEKYMDSFELDTDDDPNMAVVVIEVESGDILSMVSLPNYDNNRARYDWDDLADKKKYPDKPLINRAIYTNYPPGSVVKPLILVAGMEEKLVTSDYIISCPAQDPKEGWPRCWIWKQDHSCHDYKWGNKNNAHNAIKGSCNAYFSALGDMLDSSSLQRWLYSFGYGHKILASPSFPDYPEVSRDMRQSPGIISSTSPERTDLTLEEMPPILPRDKKRFGIGQSTLRVTPLQAANAMAALARGGLYMNPRLFKELVQISDKTPLNISQHTLDTVYEGMYAVVNERDGTAYKEFSSNLNSFKQQDVKIYGKTGSTEDPEHAWFGGFAIDSSGRKIAFAVVVEGGQHGSRDAAPLIKDILQYTIEAGYIGKSLH
ncbi:MAG: hypothetical protein JW787_08250 [Sedimentisphaerales bacterium]|nr:hypothetical protein [Sedimentisphaerales bacterium]